MEFEPEAIDFKNDPSTSFYALRSGPSDAPRRDVRPETPPTRRRDTPRGGLLGERGDVLSKPSTSHP